MTGKRQRTGMVQLKWAARLIAIVGGLALGACAQPVPVGEYSPAAAVGVRSPTDSACVGRTAIRRDTLVASVYASVGFDRPASPAVRQFREEVLRSLNARYVPPQWITAPMVDIAAFAREDTTGKAVAGSFSAGPLFDGEFLIVFGANGRVEETRVVTLPDSPELMPALISAVHRTDSILGFPPVPPTATRERTPVRVRLFGTRSTLPPPTDSTANVITIAEARFPISLLDVPAMAIARSGFPRYPSDLKSQGIQGKVYMQFIVDAYGRADVASARTVFTTHPDFAASVVRAMPDMRFVPGQVAGCPVATWVRQTFEFRLGP